MENNRSGCTFSLSPFLIATLVLLILKLCGVMTYSWFWVFSPLLIVPAFFMTWLVIGLLVILITFIIELFEG
jgi:hypothetical protein